jgi:tRNA(adenine34) deaminase
MNSDFMKKRLNTFDRKCLELALAMAKKAYRAGNFPVGAVLTIDDEIIDAGGNERAKKKTWGAHAENILIIKNGVSIQKAHRQNKITKIYSTLEPCMQCLGASVSNRIGQIFFVQKDPIGGACDLKHDNIGLWYKKVWPQIYHCPVSDGPRKLMAKFFRRAIKDGNTTGWYKKCLDHFNID